MENQAPQTYTSLHPDEMNLAVNGVTTFRPSAPPHRPRPWIFCFRDRRLEKGLLLVLLALVLATLALAVYTLIKLQHHITKAAVIQVTPDIAERFSINKTNACDDIYHMKCHEWAQANAKPTDWPSWDSFSKLNFHNNNNLSQIFENSKNSQLQSQAEEKAKLFYFTCMDANRTIETLGKQPIFDLIDKFGGWNISSSKTIKFKWSTFSSTELQETIETMKNFAGVDSFFTIMVEPDYVYTKNYSNYILTLYPLEVPLGFSPENYQQYMIKIGELLEADRDSVHSQMDAVFSFYKTLLKSVSQKPVAKALNISELDNLVPFIRWKEFFEEIAPASIKRVESDDVVVLSDLYFFENLSKLVNEYLQTDDKKIILKNFLVWRAVERMSAYLPKAFEDARREQLRKTSYISIGRSPEYCAHITNTYFGFATAKTFTQKMFDTNSTNIVRLMFNNLKNAFNKKLDELSVVDQYHKEIMRNKSDTMSLLVGFPDFILNTNELDKYYSSVDVHEDALFTNVLEAEVHKYQQQLTLLGQNAKESSWPFHLPLTPLDTNAMYRKEVNQIVVPLGILQHPDLQLKQKIPFNFGTLGFLLGHEFMHAFVNRELSSDEDENENSWPQKIKEMFQAIHRCVSKHYSRCHSPKDCRTLNEDMADISGIKLAYSAFLDWLEKQQEPQALRHNITNKKQFFFTYVQMWCTNGDISQEYLHSPFITRANKPLSYMPEFAWEFSCKPGSMLNPKRRCYVF